MSPAPRISVVLPVYNRAHLLARAVSSVLAQSFRDFELLIVDDGSSDDSLRALDAFSDSRVRVLRHERNQGCAAARNTGIRAARAPWIAFQDSDDQWMPGHLEALAGALGAAPSDVGFAYGGIVRVVNGAPTYRPHKAHLRRLRPRITDPAWIFAPVLRHGVGYLQTWLVKRETFDAVGLFDEAMRTSSDWDMLLRMALHARAVFAPSALAQSERYGDSLSATAGQRHTDMMLHVARKLEAHPRLAAGERLLLRYNAVKSLSRRGRRAEALRMALSGLAASPLHPRAWMLLWPPVRGGRS